MNISKGIATWTGLIISVLTLLPAAANGIISSLENTAVQWSSGEKVGAIVGGATAIVTLVGRFAQAVAQIFNAK